MSTPEDLLEIAQQIFSNPSHGNEIGYRTTANRSHYSAFHAAYAIQKKYALPPAAINTTGGSHLRLFNSLIECSTGIPNWMKIRAIGYAAVKVLKPYRELADYNFEKNFYQKQALTALTQAAKVISSYNAL